jgi:hypothetical protein
MIRSIRCALFVAGLLAAALASCGDDDDNDGNDGGRAGRGAGGLAGAGAGGSKAGAGTGGASTTSCGGFVVDPADPCQSCVRQNCCDAAETCLGQGSACSLCDADPYSEACQQNSDSLAFRKCRLNQCADACKVRDAKVDVNAPSQTNDTSCGDEGFSCNPVKVEKCAVGDPQSGDAKVGVCDEGGQLGQTELGYSCYAPPQKRTLGQTCGAADGFCLEGLDCYNWTDTCAKYCCVDADCSSNARCAKEPGALWGKGKVGVCLVRDSF